MKLLILFVLLIAFSVLCSMIFTNPNKHSKCCEAPADQPIIGIFGVCLYLLGMAILVAAFNYGAFVGWTAVIVWFGVYFSVWYYIKREQREYKRRLELERKGSNGQSKFAAGCKSHKKSFRISESFFYDYFLAAIIFNASSKVSSLSLNSRGMA